MIEEAIQEFPVHIRDKEQCYEVEEACLLQEKNRIFSGIGLERKVPTRNFIQKKEILSCTKFFKKKGFSPPYSMDVWHYDDEIWVIDTHIIAEDLGGNGNAILKVFYDVKSCLCWIYQWLVSSNAHTGYQQIYSVQIEMNASNGTASSQKSVNETNSVNGDDPASREFSSCRGNSKELLHTNWQQVQIESFGPHKIPYIAVREKIFEFRCLLSCSIWPRTG